MKSETQTARRRGFTLMELMIALAIVVLVISIIILAACEYKKKMQAWEPASPPVPVSTSDELLKNLKVVCIDGYEYYFASIDHGYADSDESRAVLAPKFDREMGKPSRCATEQEKPK